jgi:energy-coupling factor transport system ATP-binding protein
VTTDREIRAAEIPRPTEEPPTIEVVGLVHRYPGATRAAVDDVTLRIEPGESVAIVGQNGSGKTTLVKHLDGLLRPSSGSVLLAGQDIAARAVHELAREVGFVFQDPDDQLFERAVEREVAFGPRRIGVPPDEVAERVARALELVDLAAEARTNPYDLGLSQRKLVALASVLAMSPGVLVLDEPTSGQDPVGVARITGIVRSWVASGRTVIAITHDMAFAAGAFQRVVVMAGGRVLADGPSDRILSAASTSLLAGTGLVPPPAARIAARLGVPGVPRDAATLLASLGVRA